MSLADQIIEQGPVVAGDTMPFPTAPNGHPIITAAEINELRDELIAARALIELLGRFHIEPTMVRTGAVHIRLACRHCRWEHWTDEPGDLAELVQRATEHAEVCR